MQFDSDERQLWEGKPKQGIVFSGQDVYLVPFSIFWCGFAFFWESSVFKSGAPNIFMIWGIPFIIMGLYFVFGRFIHDYIVRFNTSYYITDKRVIIMKFSVIESISIKSWQTLKLIEYNNGLGSILFAEPQSFFNRARNMSYMLSSNLGVSAFYTINDARYVFQLLEKQKKSN